MKKITKQFLFTSLSILSLTVIGCNKDDNTGESTLEVVKGITGSVALNPGLLSTQTINEPRSFRDASMNEELSYSYVVTIDKPQTVDIHVNVIQSSGTATEGSDFTFDKDLLIPAFSTSVTGTITVFSDDLIEGDEDFTLQIGTASTSNANVTSSTVKFTIKNFLSPDLEFTFGYNQPLAIYGAPAGLTLYNISAGPNNPYDMDYIVLDESFNDAGLYEAASAAEPEKLIVSDLMTLPDGSANGSYLADGTYYIFYSLFTDATLSTIADFTPIDVPTTVDYIRRGGIAPGTFVQEKDFIPTTKAAPGDTNFVISFTKLAGVYTLNNSIPEVIASGRSSIKDKLNIAVANARRNHKN